MISQFTWPNFHGGNAEEGTRSLWLYSWSEEPPILYSSPVLYSCVRIRTSNLVFSSSCKKNFQSCILVRRTYTCKTTFSSVISMSRVLLEDRQFLKDVTFGKTKVFVRWVTHITRITRVMITFTPRSPSTLFELEKARSHLIPGIIIFLQKMCRGSLARKEYRLFSLTIVLPSHPDDPQEDGGSPPGVGQVPQVQDENVSQTSLSWYLGPSS